VRSCLPADGVAGDAEVEDSREVVEAFLAVKVVFRGERAISLEVREVFPAVATPSLAVAVSLGAAVFLGAVAVVSPEAETISPAVVAAGFPEAAIVFPAEALAVPLDITVLRMILRCFPISADRDRVAAECHRVQPESNPAMAVHRWEEALHNYRPEIAWVATSEIDPRKFPLAMKAVHERVPLTFHPNARVGAMQAIFSASPAGSGLALRLAGQSRIAPVNFRRIVLAAVNDPLLRINVQIGARAR
jgi:hypothetical protein